ncbi:hypothetical protein [Paenibacillus sp. IHBB 10380]|uniref:hypothetical protein n=1 Tax=Paenibacillus sp. IHBB 10380 TaxID=1566358 RepID=UPI0009E3AA96|nr:hypothetical protein [Paenibacillus sp. IHBB 10380]
MANRDLRLSFFSGFNFTGRRINFRRGGVAVRNLGAFRFNNLLSSFRVRSVVNNCSLTLVLFSRNNFQGSFRVFRSNTNVSNLRNLSFNNVTSSFILVSSILTDSQIREIQISGNPPCGVLVINQ